MRSRLHAAMTGISGAFAFVVLFDELARAPIPNHSEVTIVLLILSVIAALLAIAWRETP